MNSMTIRMMWLRRGGYCAYCTGEIFAGTAVVRGVLRRELAVGIRTNKFTWHPDCWIRYGMEYLEDHPYVPLRGAGQRNGKLMSLTPEQRHQRRLLIVRGSKLKAKREYYVKMGLDILLPTLDTKWRELLKELSTCGGKPTSW